MTDAPLEIGVAELDESESGNDMIARADAALYRAKRSGKNRTEQANGRAPGGEGKTGRTAKIRTDR